MNKERDRRTPQERISIEFRAKGTIAVLTDIIAGFASKSGFSIGFRPGGRPDWSAHTADMRMYGPIKKIDTWTPRKEHQIGRIDLQQLPHDICLISIASGEYAAFADELQDFVSRLLERLSQVGSVSLSEEKPWLGFLKER